MPAYRIVREDEDRFIVHDGQKEFGMPKARLRHSTVERIRKFAKGGRVDDAEGATSEEDIKAAEAMAPPPENPWFVDPNFGAPLGDAVSKAAHAILPLDNPGSGAPAAPAVAPASQGVPDLLARPPSDEPAAAPVVQAPPALPSGSGGPNVAGQVASAGQQEQGAIQQAGQIRGQGERDMAITMRNAALQAKTDAENTAMDVQQRLQQQEVKAASLKNIDPGKWWASRSVGQKISGAVGLILGGISSGMTGQPNPALGIIQKEIDRDIEAQRLNLGKGENELHMFMQGTRDLQAARHELAAQKWANVAMQIQSQHASMGSQLAAPEAQAAVAHAKQQQIVETQAAVMRQNQIREQNINITLAQSHADAVRSMLKGQQGGGGFDRRLLEQPGFEKYRERAVDLPDGSFALADDKEGADKAREGYATIGRIQSKLQRMQELLKSGNPATLDRGAADAARADLLMEMGHLHDLNRLSEVDLGQFKMQVPDLTDFIKPMAGQKLRALGKSISDKAWSMNRQLLHFPESARPKVSE